MAQRETRRDPADPLEARRDGYVPPGGTRRDPTDPARTRLEDPASPEQTRTDDSQHRYLPSRLQKRFRLIRQFPAKGGEADLFLLEASSEAASGIQVGGQVRCESIQSWHRTKE